MDLDLRCRAGSRAGDRYPTGESSVTGPVAMFQQTKDCGVSYVLLSCCLGSLIVGSVDIVLAYVFEFATCSSKVLGLFHRRMTDCTSISSPDPKAAMLVSESTSFRWSPPSVNSGQSKRFRDCCQWIKLWLAVSGREFYAKQSSKAVGSVCSSEDPISQGNNFKDRVQDQTYDPESQM